MRIGDSLGCLETRERSLATIEGSPGTIWRHVAMNCVESGTKQGDLRHFVEVSNEFLVIGGDDERFVCDWS